MSETYFNAFIVVAAASLGAVITAILQPIWTNKVGKKAALKVHVRFFPFAIPKYLHKAIDAYRANYGKDRPSSEARNRMLKIQFSSGYINIVIENTSKVRFEDVCLIVDDGVQVIYDISIDGCAADTRFSEKVDVGSLLPGSKCTAKIWMPRDFSESYFEAWKKAVKLQAREFDKILFDYPVSKYLSDQYVMQPKGAAWKYQLAGLGFIVLFSVVGARIIANSNAPKESITNKETRLREAPQLPVFAIRPFPISNAVPMPSRWPPL